jgi:CMP/dCMP kinase
MGQGMSGQNIISISGRPGSGKSSTAKRIAAELGYRHFSSGDLFRALAKERGLDLLQANFTAEQNAELDHLVDGRLQEMGKTEDKLVLDSRTAWHWIPASFKVFLDLDLLVASERILEEKDHSRAHSEVVHEDIEEYAKALQSRLASESRRYKKLYDIDPYDLSNYDLVVDTEANDLKAVADIILGAYNQWLTAPKSAKI